MRISDWSSDVCSSDLGAPPKAFFIPDHLCHMTTRGWRSAMVQSSTPYAPGCRSFLRVFKKMRRKTRVFACGTHVARTRKPLFCGHFSVLRENTGRSPDREILPLDRKRTRLNHSH